MPLVLLTTEMDKKNKEGNTKWNPEAGEEYITVDIKSWVTRLKYTTQPELETAFCDLYLKKYWCN